MSSTVDPLQGHPKYTLIGPVNSGTFGFVNLYTNIVTRENVAIKFLMRGEQVNKYVENEVLNHRLLRHPHVIEFKEVFLTEQYICIAMEYASGGNLFSYVQMAVRLQEPAARWFFQQLTIGLDYCHLRGIVNRDIKLENTLLQIVPNLLLPLLKICDFGYSKAHFLSAPKSKVGTLAYMAPEVINTVDVYDGKLSDIWSCGIMLYVMLFGLYPFDGPHPAGGAAAAQGNPQQARAQSMMTRITNMQWQIPPDVPISAECRDMLEHLIVYDPARRYTMAQIQRHPWFLSNLPPDALSMNVQCLAHTDYSGVQTVDDIKAILRSAQAAPSRYNFSNIDEDAQYGDIIEETILEEVGVGMSDNWGRQAQQQQVTQQQQQGQSQQQAHPGAGAAARGTGAQQVQLL